MRVCGTWNVVDTMTSKEILAHSWISNQLPSYEKPPIDKKKSKKKIVKRISTKKVRLLQSYILASPKHLGLVGSWEGRPSASF